MSQAAHLVAQVTPDQMRGSICAIGVPCSSLLSDGAFSIALGSSVAHEMAYAATARLVPWFVASH